MILGRVFVVVLLSAQVVVAQRNEFLVFTSKTADFGNVEEEGGAVSHTFEFTNTSDRPVKLLTVKPSCGCTTPAWSKEPVMPGARGSVTARFDPQGRPGYFTKTLTVTTDYDAEPLVLTIKGTVSSKNDFAALRETNGNWRLKASAFNMGKVWLKDEWVWKEFEVANVGERTIQVLDISAPVYIKAEASPAVLEPRQKGVIKVGYNGKQKDQYGFQSDNVELITDDEEMPRKSFSVYATVEEFFPALSPEEMSKSPHLLISETAIDLGRFASTAAIEKVITLTNTGKKELAIRSIQPNCKCIITVLEKETLSSGKAATLTIRFNPEQRKGTQQKYITIYTNDPADPVQRIGLTAYVEN